MPFLKLDKTNLEALKDCVFTGPNYRITVLTERLIRLEYNDNGIFFDNGTELVHNRLFNKPEFTVNEDKTYLVIKTKYFELQYTKGKPFLGPKIAPDANLKVVLNDSEKVWYYKHPEARNFYGSNNTLTTKLNKGLYSTDGFASIDDGQTMLLDDDGYYLEQSPGRIDTYVFMYRRDFGFALKDYFLLTGKPPLIPRYAFGIWWHRDIPYNFYDTKELIKAFNRHKIPLSVLLLGDDWHIRNINNKIVRTGFSFNEKLFSNPKMFMDYMHERGIRVGLKLDPSDGIMPYENNYEFMKNNEVTEVIPINVLNKDFINNYFKYLIKPLNDYGTDFFFINYEGKDNKVVKALNYYHFNVYQENENKRGLIMAPNTNVAGHLYPIHYSGKTTVSWKTLSFLPYFNSTASNIGISYWSHDVGGYKDGVEDSELYIRNVELACFSPIFRFSAMKGHYYKREPWRWDVKTLKIVSEYCTLRHRLIPYIYNEAYRYSKVGLPLVQPIYYLYPEIYDEPMYKNEYYFGSEMFVAPITKKKDLIMNRSVEHLFLPKGTWYDFKTGKKFPGDKRYITFQNDEDYPVYVKSGSIIPLSILEENINVTNAPKKMELHIFPGESNTYNMYEDDGISSLYQDGYYIVTRMEYNYLPNNYTLIIRPVEGKSGIIPEKRSYKIRFRNTRASSDVIVNVGNELIDVISYEEDNDFIVELPFISTTSQITVNCKGKDIEIDAIRLINEEIDMIISDLKIETMIKEEISKIIFSKDEIRKKRIKIRKLKRIGLDPLFIRMFLKLLEYVKEL